VKVWVVEERDFGLYDEPDTFTVIGVYTAEETAFAVAASEPHEHRVVHGPYFID
jgi:hypothetical protein